MSTYASPLIANVGGRDQLLIAGAEIVAGYDPDTGEQLWELPGTTKSVASTMAVSGDYVVASGGHPGSQTLCIDLSGEPKIVWTTNQKSYVPSLLIHEGTLYQAHDNSRMTCYDVKTGERLWQGRLPGADISASPVYASGHIYIVNEAGTCYVVKATREDFELVAENQLGDEAFATPTIVDSRIYLRFADSSSKTRQEFLFCIGE
jgi:outer membrane protein assembly factor BamB